jgi:hypothetical protein
VAAPSKAWVSSPSGDMDVCLLLVLCCQVEVSVTGRSFIQMSPTACGVPECDGEALMMGKPWPMGAVAPLEKKMPRVDPPPPKLLLKLRLRMSVKYLQNPEVVSRMGANGFHQGLVRAVCGVLWKRWYCFGIDDVLARSWPFWRLWISSVRVLCLFLLRA